MEYPVADRSEWYGEANFSANGGIVVMMSPERFLAGVRPLIVDEGSQDNIDDLAAHMLSGRTLDPLVIYDGGKEDGRHRAYAAISNGVSLVPVILFGDQIAKYEDCERITRFDQADTPEP